MVFVCNKMAEGAGGVGRGAKPKLVPEDRPPPIPPRDPIGPVRRPSVAGWLEDPRRFPFALVCMRCWEMRNSLQAMRKHLGECPGGKIRDLMCGPCELRTSSWPLFCDYLNHPGMETEAACRPEFRMGRTAPRLLSSPLPSLPSSTLRDVSTGGTQYRTHDSLSPDQLVSFRDEAASPRRSYGGTRASCLHHRR